MSQAADDRDPREVLSENLHSLAERAKEGNIRAFVIVYAMANGEARGDAQIVHAHDIPAIFMGMSAMQADMMSVATQERT